MANHGELFPDWRDMVQALLAAEVEFLVVGAFAVATYGHSRATKDIDFFVRPSERNASRLMKALHHFGAPLHGATEVDFATPGTILQLGVPPRRIDIITAIEGASFADALVNATTVRIAGLAIPVIGREALIQNKRTAARLQDLADVEALESLLKMTSRKRAPGSPRKKKPRQ